MLLCALIQADRGGELQKAGKADSDQSQHQHTPAFNISWSGTGLLKHVIIKYLTFHDWYLLNRCHPDLLCAFESLKSRLYKMDFFIPALVAQTNWRESDEKSCLLSLRSDAMNSVISTLQRGEHSTSVFYLSLPFHLPDTAAVTDARNKMLNAWIRENPTQRH